MGGFKKFLWSMMAIVLVLVGALLATIALVDSKMRLDLLSRLDNINYRYASIVFAAILILFALILIADVIVHKNEEREYLVESNAGDIYITRQSLNSSVKSSINQFQDARLEDSRVKIINGEKIEANIKCDIFSENDFEDLGRRIQVEIEKGLRTLTGIQDVVAEIQLNKTEKSNMKEIR